MPKEKVKTINEIDFARLNLNMIDGQDCGGFYNYHDHLIIIVPFENQPSLKVPEYLEKYNESHDDNKGPEITKLSKEQIDIVDSQNDHQLSSENAIVVTGDTKERREFQICKYFNCSTETDKKKNGSLYSYCQKHREMFKKNKKSQADKKKNVKEFNVIEKDVRIKMCIGCMNTAAQVNSEYCKKCSDVMHPHINTSGPINTEKKTKTDDEKCGMYDSIICDDKHCFDCEMNN